MWSQLEMMVLFLFLPSFEQVGHFDPWFLNIRCGTYGEIELSTWIIFSVLENKGDKKESGKGIVELKIPSSLMLPTFFIVSSPAVRRKWNRGKESTLLRVKRAKKRECLVGKWRSHLLYLPLGIYIYCLIWILCQPPFSSCLQIMPVSYTHLTLPTKA